jgi:hypothetical protein
VSYEYHVDMEMPNRTPWHSTRQGVIDLRSGKTQSVADLFGESEGARLVATSRGAFQRTRDSLRAARGTMSDEEQRAADAFARLPFDERSFGVTDVHGAPSVRFSIPGRGEGVIGNAVELDAIATDSTTWWRAVAPGIAREDDSGNDRWRGHAYHVIARYDTSGEIARVSIADSTRREWPVGSVLAPLHRIDWLDHPAIGEETRRALSRAFSQAASYDRATRVAAIDSPSARSWLHLASVRHRMAVLHLATPHATLQSRARKPARNVRAHDARACQQPGPCVRRRDSLVDGQVRGHRGISSQPELGRDRVDRPRRFSRANSSR